MLELAQLDRLLAAMPPVAAMAIRSESFDGEELRLRAAARLAEGEDWPAALRTLLQRGRARVAMHAQVIAEDGTPVATLAARFALKRA
jgi:hypothetical protein